MVVTRSNARWVEIGMALRIRERASLIRKRSAGARLLAVAALSVALAMPGIAQDKAGPGTRSTEESNNAYRAGASVSLTEPITGDFYAAGGRVRVDQPVARDAVIVGGDVSVNATVGEDLRAAAGHVTLDGKVRGEAILAGGNVTLASGSDIGGRATLAGGELMIDGRIGKDVRAYAGRISVRGVIDGDARFVAREIELLPGSRVNGTLTYTSREDLR